MFNELAQKAVELRNDQLIHIISGVEESTNRSFEVYIAKEIESILVCIKNDGDAVGLNYNIPIEEIFSPVLKHALLRHTEDMAKAKNAGLDFGKEEQGPSEQAAS